MAVSGPPLTSAPSIQIDENGPHTFLLTVTYDGQRYQCGTYINRAEAMKAGKLFVDRKDGERLGQKKRPKKK